MASSPARISTVERPRFDSAALDALTAAWKHARQVGRPLCTVADRRCVVLPFRVAGLDRILGVVPTVGEAFRAIREEGR